MIESRKTRCCDLSTLKIYNLPRRGSPVSWHNIGEGRQSIHKNVGTLDFVSGICHFELDNRNEMLGLHT